MNEVLIKGGTVIDGTGSPRFQADVLLADGKIKRVGKGLSTKGKTVDATGLAVTPGIIDLHTHMDGQFFFEPKGTSSSWHGVTTVLMGHCGYSLAPIKPEHREYIISMFARVEEVPQDVLKTLPWNWESFGQYMDAMDGTGMGINAIPQVGHSTLRYYTMGPDASKREATEDEVRRMRQTLHESLQAGAFGFTSSRSPSQVAWDGMPVPSRNASPEELIALAGELKDFKSTLGLIPSGIFSGMTEEDKKIITAMVVKSGGKTIQLNGVQNPAAQEYMKDAMSKGMIVYCVSGTQPFYRQFNFFEGTNAFNSTETWWNVMMERSQEERFKALADPALRPALRKDTDAEQTMDGMRMRRPRLVWSEVRVVRTVKPENKHMEGKSIEELSKSTGKHKVDVMLDLTASEGFKTQFIYRFMPESAWLKKANGASFNNPWVFPMNSDAGAHLANECKTGESTYFLKQWVMNLGVMSLEDGVAKVTGHAAKFVGLPDRGVIKEGLVADVAVFDLEKLAALPKEQVFDLPGGGTRWIQRASGVQHVFVNGEATFEKGKETGNLPGKVIRNTKYQ